MTPLQLGIIGFTLLVVFIMLRVPVAFSMFFVGIAGFFLISSNLKATMSMVAIVAWDQFSSYTYTAAIMFIWMGYIAAHSGLSKYIFEAADTCIGHIPAGLEMATTVACALFGAICGSTLATTATMGSIALPEMDKYGHDVKLSRGVVASSGLLGIMIPPSIPLIVYGITTETSIGKLFLATIPAGIMLCILYCLTSAIIVMRKPELAPKAKKSTWGERFRVLFRSGTAEVIFIFVFVLTGMFAGWFSPTESGAIGAFTMLAVTLIRRRLTWKAFFASLRDTTQNAGMIFIICIAATVFGNFISRTGLPGEAVRICGELNSPFLVMLFVMLMITVLGCLMDGYVVMLLTLPIAFPIATGLGYHPVFLGVWVVLLAGIGMITPPVGMSAYVAQSIDPREPKTPLTTIFAGIVPYCLVSLAMCIVLILAPGLITWIL